MVSISPMLLRVGPLSISSDTIVTTRETFQTAGTDSVSFNDLNRSGAVERLERLEQMFWRQAFRRTRWIFLNNLSKLTVPYEMEDDGSGAEMKDHGHEGGTKGSRARRKGTKHEGSTKGSTGTKGSHEGVRTRRGQV